MNDKYVPSSKDQLIALEMRPTSVEKTELVVRFNRPFTTAEMNAMHRGLNLHLVGGPDETQPVASNEWGGVEKLAQQRNDALAEVERLRNALSQSIGTVKRLMTESRQVETTGELERLRALQEKALALDDAVAEFGIDKPQYIAEVYQAFHDALHDGHGAMHAVEPECICAKKLDGQIIETHLACELHGVKASAYPSDELSHTSGPAPSDKCEHGIPRQFCTAVHAEKTSACTCGELWNQTRKGRVHLKGCPALNG